MGSIVRVERAPRTDELRFLKAAGPARFGLTRDVRDTATRGIQYQIRIDRILKPPGEGISEACQLYLLCVHPMLSLAYEHAFMDWSLVIGAFPSEVVNICFPIVGDRVFGSWGALSFEWAGNALAVEHIDKAASPPDERLGSVFRGDWLEEALHSFRRLG